MIKHKIETMVLADLKPAPYNPRAISDQAFAGLKESVNRFGLVQPIIFNKRTGHVVGGHQRIKALEAAGETVALTVVVDLPKSEEKALNVALNNPHIEGEFTNDIYGLLDELQKDVPELFAALKLDQIATFRRRDIEEILGEGEVADAKGSAENDLFPPEEIVENAFTYFRRVGFPYPSMELFEMKQELNRLANLPSDTSVKSNVGYQVADHFHRHRFHASAIGTKAPYDSFHDDKLLKRALTMEYRGSRRIKPGYNGFFSLTGGTQACANFRPAFARMMYNRYCPKGGKILDPSTGYGGRLVGFLGSHASMYYGVDPNTKTYEANKKLTDTLCPKDKRVILHRGPFEDWKDKAWTGKFDLAFTSPPYFKKEIYSDEKTNSCNRYPEYQDWKKGFLQPLLGGCLRALRRGGLAIINIADVNIGKDTFPLELDTVETARSCGFKLKDTLSFPLTIRMHLDKKSDLVIEEMGDEAVFVFEK